MFKEFGFSKQFEYQIKIGIKVQQSEEKIQMTWIPRDLQVNSLEHPILVIQRVVVIVMYRKCKKQENSKIYPAGNQTRSLKLAPEFQRKRFVVNKIVVIIN